ncbi:MAG: hypothetical protein AB7O48_03555 [Cyclobacteriaceae bacterium]
MNEIGIEIEFFEPEDKFGPIKATVHKSGRIGFSLGANKLIDFEANKLFKIGRRKDGDNDQLFMVPVTTKDEMTFEVVRAGAYYSIRAKRLLSQMGIDYRDLEESIIYYIDEVKNDASKYYKLTRKKKRSNNT